MATVFVVSSSTTVYDSLRGLLGRLTPEFAALGHTVVPLSMDEMDSWLPQLQAPGQRKEQAFAVGMSGIGLEIFLPDKRLLWEALAIPYFDWVCDHPCYFINRHRLSNRYVIHGYVFPDHAAFNRDYLQANGAAHAIHLGLPLPWTYEKNAPPDAGNRLVFVKSAWNPAAMETMWRRVLPSRTLRMQFEIIEAASGRGCEALPEAVVEVGTAHGAYLTPGGELFNAYLTRADNYIRAAKTHAVAQVLVQYPVDFCGGGWDYMKPGATEARFHGPVPFEQAQQALSGYLGAVSLNPNTLQSVHDRVFFALAAGVTPIHDSTPFARETMPMLDPFRYTPSAGSLAAALEALFSRPAEARERVAATRAAMTSAYSMRAAAGQIVDICLETLHAAAGLYNGMPSPFHHDAKA